MSSVRRGMSLGLNSHGDRAPHTANPDGCSQLPRLATSVLRPYSFAKSTRGAFLPAEMAATTGTTPAGVGERAEEAEQPEMMVDDAGGMDEVSGDDSSSGDAWSGGIGTATPSMRARSDSWIGAHSARDVVPARG